MPSQPRSAHVFRQLTLGAALLALAAPAAAQQEVEARNAIEAAAAEEQIAKAPHSYTEDWPSLAQIDEAPEWFQDAKFGIYAHWGPSTTGNQGISRIAGWYGMHMYMDPFYDWKTGEVLRKPNGEPRVHIGASHHKERWGDPKTFGFKDVIKEFNPARFDAAEWAELFEASGARFAGPVAMHHDNFAMWDSQATRWNSRNYGGIDVAGELKREIEARDMKFIMSFHHAFTWVYYANAWNYDATEETSDLYTDKHELTDFTPTQRFRDEWWAKLKEPIDKYQPDIVWFDWWVEALPEADRKKFMAYYFNKGEEWGKDVVVSYKNTSFPAETGVHDYERGRPNVLKDRFWMTDTSPGAWFYYEDAKFVSTNEIVDILVDIVSKNGLMLLNVPPTAEGAIPPEMQTMLRDIGGWLELNGEGIYQTRPFGVFGEGPTRLPAGGHKVEKKKIVYTQDDIRFTRSKDGETVYAFVLDTPTKDIAMRSLGSAIAALPGPITSVSMLGSDEPIAWKQYPDALMITKPAAMPSDLAVGFKIELNVRGEIGIGGEEADPENDGG